MAEAVIIVDQQQHIVLFSPGAERMFGYSAAEVMGLPLDTLLPEQVRRAHRRHVAGFANGDATFRTMTGRPEIQGRRRDGSVFSAGAVLSRADIGDARFMAAVVYDLEALNGVGVERGADESAARPAVIDNPVGIAFFDVAGQCVHANPTAALQLGLAPHSLVGAPAEDWMSAGNASGIRRLVRPVVQQLLPFATGSVEYLRPDGSSFSAQLTVAPILWNRGSVTHVVALIEDRSIGRFQNLVETVEGIVWEMHPETLAPVFVSQEATRLLGYPTTRWLSAPGFWREIVHPDDRQRVVDWRRQAVMTPPLEPMEYRVIAEDGSVVWLRDGVRAVSGGSHELLRGISVDITEHKRRETDLREKTLELESINRILSTFLSTGSEADANRLTLHSALAQTGGQYGFLGIVEEGGLCIIDTIERCGGRVDSPEVVTGFDAAGASPIRECGHERCLQRLELEALPAEVLEGGTPVLWERSGDSRSPLGLPWHSAGIDNFAGVPIEIGGSVVGVLGIANLAKFCRAELQECLGPLARVAAVLHDARRRTLHEAEMEQWLQRSQRMEAIGQLTGGIAHDFNNLLLVVQGNAEIIQQALAPWSSEYHAAQQILHASQRAADLTRNLLAFARRNPMAPRPIDAERMLRDIRPMLQRTLGEHIEVVVLGSGTACRVMADRSLLENGLLNMALNARDAMSDGGTLTLQHDCVELYDAAAFSQDLQPGRYGRIRVSDTGKGMSAEARERLFEPFFTTKGPGKGTGLGLAMVYGFAKQSGGQVSVISEPGMGTTLTLLLPLAGGDTCPINQEL